MQETDNHIIIWLKSDDGLCDVINGIDVQNLSQQESARLAFYSVSDYLKLPKQPEDITEQMYKEFEEYGFEPESVFEQMAVINYIADANDDTRGLVLQALYNVYHKEYHGVEYAAEVYFGSVKKIPKTYSYYLFGTDVDARIEFSIKGENWIDAGARMMKKVV